MVMEGVARGQRGRRNILRGEGGADWLAGGWGMTGFMAAMGDDTLLGGSGSDRVDGGLGVDVASLRRRGWRGWWWIWSVCLRPEPWRCAGGCAGRDRGAGGLGVCRHAGGDGWANGLWAGRAMTVWRGGRAMTRCSAVRATTRWWAGLATTCSRAGRGRTGRAGRHDLGRGGGPCRLEPQHGLGGAGHGDGDREPDRHGVCRQPYGRRGGEPAAGGVATTGWRVGRGRTAWTAARATIGSRGGGRTRFRG